MYADDTHFSLADDEIRGPLGANTTDLIPVNHPLSPRLRTAFSFIVFVSRVQGEMCPIVDSGIKVILYISAVCDHDMWHIFVAVEPHILFHLARNKIFAVAVLGNEG